MTLQEFIAKYNGQPIDFDGAYGNQCVDLMNQYLVDVCNISNPIQTLPGDTAFEIFENTNNANFEKIDNTPTGVPQAGDIIFWNTTIGSAGHVAVFISGDANNFTSFDQNWPTGSVCHEQAHDYNGVAGWLHFKGTPVDPTTVYPYGLDLTNTDSVKVAVDTWHDVATGAYVPKATYQDALGKLETAKGVVDDLTSKLEQVEKLFDDYKATYPDPAVTSNSTDTSTIVKIAVTTPQVPEVSQTLQTSVEQAKQATNFSLLDWLKKLFGLK